MHDVGSNRPVSDHPDDIAADVVTVGNIEAVPTLLQILCQTTGMGFAAVARVTDKTWTACAVQDTIGFGLRPGGQLDVNSTLCIESRAARQPIAIDHASQDSRYCDHHTPRQYKIESYISVPIITVGGRYFGNLCAIDPHPRVVSDAKTIALFEGFAQLVAIQFDIAAKTEAEQAVLRDERAASELREQFIAILGHDLRNPLQAVISGAHLLKKKYSDPTIQDISTRIGSSAHRMSGLIDDVLDFARARLGGGIGVKMREADDIDHTILSVVKELQEGRPDRQILSNISVRRTIRCDPGRVQQIASNLIANALTHGSASSPVKVTAATDHESLVLQVWNDGEPIPAESLGRIFEPFWRQSTSQDRQGLGLGLHICAQIVRAHNGTINVQSTKEHGTQFTARLPISG